MNQYHQNGNIPLGACHRRHKLVSAAQSSTIHETAHRQHLPPAVQIMLSTFYAWLSGLLHSWSINQLELATWRSNMCLCQFLAWPQAVVFSLTTSKHSILGALQLHAITSISANADRCATLFNARSTISHCTPSFITRQRMSVDSKLLQTQRNVGYYHIFEQYCSNSTWSICCL